MDPLTTSQTSAYLARLGFHEKPLANLATLHALMEAHVQHIPFENIDVLLNRTIHIDADSLFAKVVERGRGGHCVELNSLFGRLLEALGYRLRLRVARLRWGLDLDAPLTLKQHLVLIVMLTEGEFIVDVGFSAANPFLPLPLKEQGSRSADHPYMLRPLGAESDCEEGTLELCVRDRQNWIPMFRIEPRDHRWPDVTPLNWYLSTHPESTLRGRLIVGRTDGESWLNLKNGRFTHRMRRHGCYAIEKRDVRDADELLSLLEKVFRLPLCPEKDVEPLKTCLAKLLLVNTQF